MVQIRNLGSIARHRFVAGLGHVVGLLTLLWLASASAGQEPPATRFGTVGLTWERVAPNCGSPCDRDLVIFVHGVSGSRETWVNTKTKAYWPNLISEDQELAEFDVARLDYESYLLSRGPSIEEVLVDMQEAVKSMNTLKYRTVQF